MASNAKKKTTMAKMNRENAVRERRLRKQAKRDARKQAATGQPGGPSDPPLTANREAPDNPTQRRPPTPRAAQAPQPGSAPIRA
jgi:hypothetical protein